MELFGKELMIDIDEQQQQMLFNIGVGLFIVILMYFFIVKPSLLIKENKQFYQEEILRHEKTSMQLKDTKKKYDIQVAKYEEQKGNYDKLLVKMENASLQNNAILKEVVQKLVDYTNVEILSIGAIEVGATSLKESYEKRYVPYTVNGKGREITKLFYYFENSEWLLTLKGNPINLRRVGSGEDEIVNTTFKLGAYYPKNPKVEKKEEGNEN